MPRSLASACYGRLLHSNCIVSCASATQTASLSSHINMATSLSSTGLFYSYSTRQPLSTAMEPAQPLQENVDMSGVVQNGSVPEEESPARGVSGANPKLVNGQAVLSEEERQVLSAQSVLKKVLTVSEAELLQSSAVDEARGALDLDDGGAVSTNVNGLPATQVKEREAPDGDNSSKVRVQVT